MKIQKTLRCLALATMAGLLASSAVAQVAVSLVTGYSAGDGEFNVTPVRGAGYGAAALVSGGYETFCISRKAGIGLPGNYLDTISNAGVAQPGGPISKGSAWLYDQFSKGTLPNYHYAGAAIVDPGHTLSERAEDAYTLQLAFWTLEGDYSYPGTLADAINSNPWLAKVAVAFGGGTTGLVAAMADNTPGDYGVGVLNLKDANGVAVQPLLVRVSNVCTGSICGNVFADCNGDGDLTATDVGLKNVLVKLLNAAGQQVATVNTDTNGSYCFDNLVGGTYKVVVTPPAGYKQTIASTGHYWKDSYGRRCWIDNDDNAHCIDNGVECWRGKDGCTHWKDGYGRDCWKDSYNNYRCQAICYKPCYSTNNDNTLSVTITNCQGKIDVDFAYTGTTPNIVVCVKGPSSAKCGQTVTYTCTVTNTGNVCFSGGTVCHTIGYNCWGWWGNSCNFTTQCPPLSPGQSCVVTQKCNVDWGWAGKNISCQSFVTCAQPAGTSACGQSSWNTQCSW